MRTADATVAPRAMPEAGVVLLGVELFPPAGKAEEVMLIFPVSHGEQVLHMTPWELLALPVQLSDPVYIDM